MLHLEAFIFSAYFCTGPNLPNGSWLPPLSLNFISKFSVTSKWFNDRKTKSKQRITSVLIRLCEKGTEDDESVWRKFVMYKIQRKSYCVEILSAIQETSNRQPRRPITLTEEQFDWLSEWLHSWWFTARNTSLIDNNSIYRPQSNSFASRNSPLLTLSPNYSFSFHLSS